MCLSVSVYCWLSHIVLFVILHPVYSAAFGVFEANAVTF